MPDYEITRIRRFLRSVTREAGVLDQSFLGRGRPLGVARVLNAIGHGRQDVAAIRAYLDLDSGLMSRLLRSLEDEGLITTQPDPADARRRVAQLTEAGAAEFQAYERLSDERAERLLQPGARGKAVLAAMDLIASTLGRGDVEFCETDPRDPAAHYCLESFYGELNARFDGGFDVGLSADPDATSMIRPVGTFLVAWSDGLPLGCGGLKGHGEWGEVKRLWIDPSMRGLGLATEFMDRLEQAARELGMDTLRLDTNRQLAEATAMYPKLGWTEIPRFNDDPYPDVFFEKYIA